MKKSNFLLLVLLIIVFSGLAGVTGFIGYRTISNTGQLAVSMMNEEGRAELELLSSIKPTMNPEQVYEKLGLPSQDLYLVAKWNGFGGSSLSQMRVYFAGGHPRKIRWIKIGFFSFESDL